MRGAVRGAKNSGKKFGNVMRHGLRGPVHDGSALPDDGVWDMLPGFMDVESLALPMMAIAARPLLTGASAEVYREMEGMAAGAGIPFDAYWLLQNAQRF